MKTSGLRNSTIEDHRRTLSRLVHELQQRPLKFIPERSVTSLQQFFTGYGMFGTPVRQELSAFEHWLRKRLFYPRDAGSTWCRFIQLNSGDAFHSFELFFELYSEYLRKARIDTQPNVQEPTGNRGAFDFYSLLYAIGRRPGLYLGSGDSVQLIAAYLSGYFKGKSATGLKLSRDEKEFFRFEEWLRRHHRFKKPYPWFRLVEMWSYRGLNSFESFYAYYDAYLTDFGKKPRGLEDLFEVVKINPGTTTIRRRKKLPRKLVLIPESKRWWRV
jgi:hypothetical protein